MSESKKLIPRRRFKEFEGAQMWEKLRLGDHAIIKGRLGWKSLKQEEYVDHGPSMIAGKHITEGIINWNKVDHIPQWRYDESPEIMLKNGDIIFSKDGSLGNPALITNLNSLATINSTMMLVRLKKNISSIFFYQVMLSSQFENLVRLKVSGSSIPHLFQADMTEFKFNTPEVDEQTQIGEFFKKLDNLINTQQKKLEKAKTLKSAYLREMFPNEGELKPRLRFIGNDNYWQCLSLGDLTNIKTGDSDAQDSVINGAYPFFVRSENIERSNRYLYDGEAILIPGEGRLGEIFHYIKGKFDYHQRVYKISDFREDINGKFVFYYMQKTFKKHALKYTVKATVDSLRLPMLTDYLLLYPSLKEQNNISSLFEKLDNKIALEQKKLDKLKNIKQAYLNEMFI